MPFHKTDIPDLLVYEPKIFEDSRGYFFESFNLKHFEEVNLNPDFVQDNQARSVRGVVRGLHYQHEPKAQSKLIRVLQGEILDVAVDIRQDSPTFGQHHSILLSDENKLQLYVPRGFAHGYAVLSETAEVFYKCDNFYAPDHEGGISLWDKTLAIDWKIPYNEMIVSSKDQKYPTLHEAEFRFKYEK